MGDSMLKKNDPFLKYIWEKYNLDNEVNVNEDNDILLFCKVFDTDFYNLLNQPKNICRKLLRNLKVAKYSNIPKDHSKHCSNILYWLYYEIKEHKISKESIKGIFDALDNIINDGNIATLNCSGLITIEDLLQPEELVMLYIFMHNIDVIQEILNKDNDIIKCSCKKFIKQCVDSYKSKYEDYPTNCNDMKTNKFTCLAVNEFKTRYEGNLSDEKIKYSLPQLSSETPTDIIDCNPSEKIDLLP
ncbi:hypothetical protein PCYB_003800, partial [Plasmodium cynomolgi strain B]